MSSPHVAILVVNYQTRSHIIDLIRSYTEHETYRSVHWYIADNASGDTLDDIPSLYPDLDIEILMCPRNGGFGYGNNRLAEILGDEGVLYLVNPDILWVEPILERLISTLSDPHVGVVGPRLMMGDGSTQSWDHGESQGWIARIAMSLGSSYWREVYDTRDVAWVSGAALMIRRSDFEVIGGFDEGFFLYREEEDLCIRMRMRDMRVVYDPRVSMRHIGSVVAKKGDHFRVSHRYFFSKYHPVLNLLYPVYALILALYFLSQD